MNEMHDRALALYAAVCRAPTSADAIGAIKAAFGIERERCARIAVNGCLVPPDGGSPTEDERRMCDSIAAAIRNPQS